MMPQPSGNGAQFAGDDRTQVLAPVGKGDDATQILAQFTWMLDDRRLQEPYGYRYASWGSGFERDRENIRSDFDKALTEVIPVTPAKPEPPKANNDDPWKECMVAVIAGAILAAVVFAAGVVVGGMWF